MVYRCILSDWAEVEHPNLRKVREGEFTPNDLVNLNNQFYNIYYLPNPPSLYTGGIVDGSQIDTFNWVFVDMDLKDEVYPSKDAFIERVCESGIPPTKLVDSGGGVHAYWKISDLNVMSYLKFQRRLMRLFSTDEAVGQIYQLMRVPGYVNTKRRADMQLCQLLHEDESIVYTSEQLDTLLPPLTHEDDQYCQHHYQKTMDEPERRKTVVDKMPARWNNFLASCPEAKAIWMGKSTKDRSTGDFRLGHLMFAEGFTKDEATSVLVNSAKALTRAPVHRASYAFNIVDQIWTYEMTPTKDSLTLHRNVRDLIAAGPETLAGTRFYCHEWIDATQGGMRLGQVMGLVAGSGVGKTAMALNMFYGFVKKNPEYVHFFVPLEQPAHEIAARWKTLCGEETDLHDRVEVLSNYNDDNSFRHLSLTEIRDYLLKYQTLTGKKIGSVVIDHIGALKKKSKDGENQGTIEICHEMKPFAIALNTFLVMQSQAPREKAGIGDLELNKDAAYGTVFFESYCDYLVAIWQPLKRCYAEGAPTVTAFKFCKIRNKKAGFDHANEDTPYKLMFDTTTEKMRMLTQKEDDSFTYFNSQATNKRKADRKTDVVEYTSVNWLKGDTGGDLSNSSNPAAATSAKEES